MLAYLFGVINRVAALLRGSPGLQDDYELLEAKRALDGELDGIVPRAA